jgi:hypothetical protein
MKTIRFAVLCFLIASALAARPAYAQGKSPTAALTARVEALEAAVAKLGGNITADEFFGKSYNLYLLGVAMDPPGTQATFNQMASYVQTGIVTFESNFRGTINGAAAGIVMTEQAANQNWTNVPASGTGTAGFTWSYSSGVLSITMDNGAEFNDLDLSVLAGGQALVSAIGGAPGNNQQVVIVVRRP